MLKRYGIIVDEDKLKSEGFNAVIETMQTNFEGTAEAVAKSGTGPMKQFGNTIGDVKERIGEALMPAINDMIESLVKWLPTIEKVALGITAVISTVIEGISNVADIISKVTKFKFKEAFEVSVKHGENINKIWSDMAKRMVEIEEKAKEKKVKIIKDEGKIRVEQSDAWKKRLAEEAEKELAKISKDNEKKLKLQEKLEEEKENLRLQGMEKEAAAIENMNERITGLFVQGVDDWSSAWDSFRNYIVDFVLKDIINNLVTSLALGKALKATIGIGGGGFLGFVGGLLGFQGGGTVPGPIGKPRAIMAHGGETVSPVGGATTRGGGAGITFIFQISGTFLEADETKWQRLWREKLKPEMQRELRKTGESFKGK